VIDGHGFLGIGCTHAGPDYGLWRVNGECFLEEMTPDGETGRVTTGIFQNSLPP
jgi:hypothetical protein